MMSHKVQQKPLQIGVITLFASMFTALNYGIVGRAFKQQLINIHYWDPRDYSRDKHRHVDDRSYGGGPGMVMMAQPLKEAILAAKRALGEHTPVIYLSPQGRLIDQGRISTWSHTESLIFVAGRYEGIDERLIRMVIDEEWSIGDYILSGGEFAAMTVIDAMTRLLPGALGDENSAVQESFTENLLDHPHYTRPAVFEGRSVPSVLLSGDHQAIQHWRLKQSLGRSWLRRPQWLSKRQLTKLEANLLHEFKVEAHD